MWEAMGYDPESERQGRPLITSTDLPRSNVYMIQRRTGARPPPPAAPAVKAQGAKTSKPSTESTVPAKRPLQKEASPAKTEATKSDEPKSEPSSAANSQTSSKPSGKAAPAKQKGNLFSSFAKAKPKKKTSVPAEPVRAITRAAFFMYFCCSSLILFY